MKKKIDLPEVEPVKLKSFHSIRPGVIILSALIALILLLFFLLCMLPGIVKGGKYVSFSSPITEVGVYIDDIYIGSTEGSNYFISSGNHTLRYVKEGVSVGKFDIKIGHPIFFTLFHHSRENIDLEAVASDELIEEINRNFLKGVSSWSKVTSFSSVTHLPPLFSNYAKDIKALNVTLDESIWEKAEAHISSSEMLNDYNNACSILGINPKISETYFLEDNNPEYNSKHTAIMPEKDGSFYLYPSSSFEMGSYLGTSYPLTNEKRISVLTDDFYISERPVSEYEYALFVSENPSWRANNKDELINEGLVDENYLNGITLSTNYVSNRPIRNISYHAASAYAEWLSKKEGIHYYIPSEAEWSLAAYSAENKRYATSLNWTDMDDSTPKMMMGGLWEFTKESYVPLSRLLGSFDSSLEGDDVIIKGGSYLNNPDEITADSVGLISKNRCSEYVGFRVCHE